MKYHMTDWFYSKEHIHQNHTSDQLCGIENRILFPSKNILFIIQFALISTITIYSNKNLIHSCDSIRETNKSFDRFWCDASKNKNKKMKKIYHHLLIIFFQIKNLHLKFAWYQSTVLTSMGHLFYFLFGPWTGPIVFQTNFGYFNIWITISHSIISSAFIPKFNLYQIRISAQLWNIYSLLAYQCQEARWNEKWCFPHNPIRSIYRLFFSSSIHVRST